MLCLAKQEKVPDKKHPQPVILKAPAQQIQESHRSEDPDCSDRKSPVSGQELDTNLASMFFTGKLGHHCIVKLSSLCQDRVGVSQVFATYLSILVDLPRLDNWKLEELNRLLNTNKDNRYVDMELWSEVWQSWLEMVMDPGWYWHEIELRMISITILTQVLEMLVISLNSLRRKKITMIKHLDVEQKNEQVKREINAREEVEERQILRAGLKVLEAVRGAA